MANLKKSILGGYSKTSVDALIEELNKQINSLKEKESSLTDAVMHKDSDIADLSAKIDKMKSEIETLTAENSSLKAETNKSRSVFENVAKIYERAYGAGHDIVLDSKTHSEQMLDHMNRLFYTALKNADETIARQNSLKQEISSLYGKLDLLINELTNNTDNLFKEAENYISIFEDFKGIKANTEEQAEIYFKEFEDFAAEFLTTEEIRKTETDFVAAENTVPSPVVEDEQAIPSITQNEEIIEPIVSETKEDPATETNETFTQQQKTDEIAPSPESEPEQEVFDTIIQGETTTPDNAEAIEEPAAEVNIPMTEPQKSETTSPNEQKTESTEFTQFGRKSKISAQDRSELLRKALLKNGGN